MTYGGDIDKAVKMTGQKATLFFDSQRRLMRNQSAQTESMEQLFKTFVARIELLTKE